MRKLWRRSSEMARTVMRDEIRYPAVPWLSQSDFLPAGRAEWAIETTDSIALGWVVRHPWNAEDHVMLIRATRGNGNDGGVITLSLRESVEIDTRKAPVRNIQHSRTFNNEGDGWED